MNIIVPPCATDADIDELVAGIVAELADAGERATPEALARLREQIETFSRGAGR